MFVLDSRLVLGDDCRARLDGRRLVLEHVPLIRRLIWYGLDVSHMCNPEPMPLCLYGGVARVGIRQNEPFCPVHMAVGLVHQHDGIWTDLAQGPRHRIAVVACILGSSLLGPQGRILWQPGPWSICR